MRASVLIFFGFTSLLARTYHASGVVISVDHQAGIVTVSHAPIPKFMGAMVMPFRAKSAKELEGLQPGNRIEFELVVEHDRSFLRRIQRIPGTDLPVPVPANRLAPGAEVPDFQLIDQHGSAFHLSQLRGKVVLLNFLYTRCPLPDVCPRLAANFAAVYKRYASRSDLALVSVTVDPEYDTPPILKEYAARWGVRDRGRWCFLTGPLKDIERISGYFGLVSWAEEGTLSHTSSTAVVSREGRLVAIVEGSTYRLNQLVDLVQAELGGKQ